MSNAGARKTCLLILPRSFYSFAKIISNTLGDLGYDTVVANEEYPENPLGKILAKLDLPIARSITRKVIKRRFLEGHHYDLVLIIKGRGIGPELMQDLKEHADRVVGYHFDALAYDRATERWAKGADRVSTFDYRDAAAKGWPLVELFSAEEPPRTEQTIAVRFSAIMRNHSNRLRYLDAVVRALDIAPRDAFVYIFEQDIRSLAWNFLKQPRLYWRWRHSIHHTPLSYDEYRRVLATSDFTIDYAHPKQSGLTMRSFEALANGAKLISNNPNVRESRHFEREHAIVFRPGDDPVALRDAVAELAGRRPARRWRSARDCIEEIIGAAQVAEAI